MLNWPRLTWWIMKVQRGEQVLKFTKGCSRGKNEDPFHSLCITAVTDRRAKKYLYEVRVSAGRLCVCLISAPTDVRGLHTVETRSLMRNARETAEAGRILCQKAGMYLPA